MASCMFGLRTLTPLLGLCTSSCKMSCSSMNGKVKAMPCYATSWDTWSITLLTFKRQMNSTFINHVVFKAIYCWYSECTPWCIELWPRRCLADAAARYRRRQETKFVGTSGQTVVTRRHVLNTPLFMSISIVPKAGIETPWKIWKKWSCSCSLPKLHVYRFGSNKYTQRDKERERERERKRERASLLS